MGRAHTLSQLRQHGCCPGSHSQYSQGPSAHALVALYAFFTASHQIGIQARHLPGALNIAADAQSRDNMTIFFASVPQARREAVEVPAPLLDML